MVIRLSSAMVKRVERVAKARGVKPSKLVEDALKEYLAPKQPDEISEARRQLNELLKHKKKTGDFDAAVERAKRRAGELYEANADWIERVSADSTEHARRA